MNLTDSVLWTSAGLEESYEKNVKIEVPYIALIIKLIIVFIIKLIPMKAIKILFVVMVLLPITVLSQIQNTTSYATMPGDMIKTLIRETQNPASISYVETTTGHYFVYYDGVSSNAITVSISSNYKVTDFVIGGDTAYFCGRTSNGEGFFGHFHINDFFYMTPHNYVVSTTSFFTTQGPVISFEKIVTYKDMAIRKLAMIGRTQQGVYVVAEVQYNPITFACNYQLGLIDTNYSETILGIAVTDNNVVTAGYVQNSLLRGYLCIRAHQKNNMFMTGGPQENAFVYTPNDTLISEFDGTQLVIAHLDLDRVSIGTYYKHLGSLNNQGVYIGVFQISNTGNISSFTSIIVPQNFYGGWRMRGITGFNASNCFYYLQNAELSATIQNASNICGMWYSILISTTSFLGYRTGVDYLLQSIDSKATSNGYVSNGGWSGYPDRLLFNYGSTLPSSCMNSPSQSYNKMLLNKHEHYRPYYSVEKGSNIGFQIIAGVMNHVQVTNVCTE